MPAHYTNAKTIHTQPVKLSQFKEDTIEPSVSFQEINIRR